ncbi:DUF2799 domain-containing protein [Rhodovulum sp. DZ06]|uniref:DUF2799 domain-containing protein n=1 Tax=Rhodovulum sp. DZ06 TaxID=3425126 RepID=UPI003D351F91
MRHPIRLPLLLVLAAAGAAACTAPGAPPAPPPPGSCPAAPAPAAWRDAGLVLGASGVPAAEAEARLSACAEGTPALLDAALSGHAEGVGLYCTAENGARLGRAGLTPTLSCPGALGARFSEGYALGAAGMAPRAAGRAVDGDAAGGAAERDAADDGLLGLPTPTLRPSIGIGIGSGGRISTGLGIGLWF